MMCRAALLLFLLATRVAMAQDIAASCAQPEYPPAGAHDGDCRRDEPGASWRGLPGAADGWWWHVQFDAPRQVGSILQVHGEGGDVLAHAPAAYVWQQSNDGAIWRDLSETVIAGERRMFRLHRLLRPVTTRHLRLRIATSRGDYPTLREVEFFPETDAKIDFPPWVLSVNITDRRGSLDGIGHVRVLRQTAAGKEMLAQHIDVTDVDPDFVAVEPRPLCMFLSGSYRDWCEVDRSVYHGLEQVLKRRLLPIWGSCGGCQLLAILEATGVDQPWDCPHCRDPAHPLLPIYTHLRCTDRTNARTACGDYAQCGMQQGPVTLLRIEDDPVFDGLPADGRFTCREAHCGQIAFLPPGWTLLATHVPGGNTVHQLMKVAGHPIYAAQFHIDMGGEHAEILAANFVTIALQYFNRRSRTGCGTWQSGG